MSLCALLALLSLLFVLYIYLGYPFLVCFLADGIRRNNKIGAEEGERHFPSVTVLIPCFNEEKVIAEKIENTLSLDYPNELLSILVVSDGSTDRTNEIVSEYTLGDQSNVEFYEVPSRKGKTNALNLAIEGVRSDVVVFTDANVFLDRLCVKNIVKEFIGADVGGVSGQLNYTNDRKSDTTSSAGLYWRYEEMIKKSESLIGSICGADGSIFAIRTHLYRKLPEYVLDDFCTSMGVVMQGYRFSFCENALAFEKAPEVAVEEFQRKVRISNRSINSYRYLKPTFRIGCVNSWMFISHKLLRWFSFVFILLGFVFSSISVAFSRNESIANLMFAGYCIAALYYLMGKTGLPLKRPGGAFLDYFVEANVACAIGVFKSYTGTKITTWSKAESSR